MMLYRCAKCNTHIGCGNVVPIDGSVQVYPNCDCGGTFIRESHSMYMVETTYTSVLKHEVLAQDESQARMAAMSVISPSDIIECMTLSREVVRVVL